MSSNARRTAEMCDWLKHRGMYPIVRERTGLIIDAYFSATKVRWLLDHTPNGQRRAEASELCAGPIDSWILYRLTHGTVHATYVSNASRTMVFNIHSKDWDTDLISSLEISLCLMPKVQPSASIFGETDPELFGAAVLIASLIRDQSAALFGPACFQPGMAKDTYGTRSFLLTQTGEQPVPRLQPP